MMMSWFVLRAANVHLWLLGPCRGVTVGEEPGQQRMQKCSGTNTSHQHSSHHEIQGT